jgi:hypothetical protein
MISKVVQGGYEMPIQNKTTSPQVATLASEVLRKGGGPMWIKTLAGSVLVQRALTLAEFQARRRARNP